MYLPEGRDEIQRTENGTAAAISVCGLTHEGHEFIGNIREDKTWKQTKEKTESIALDVVKDTAKGIVMGSIGL